MEDSDFKKLAFAKQSAINVINTFWSDPHNYEEHIHAIVLDYVEVDRHGAPEIIKVMQIHNLEEYFNNPETAIKTERILKVNKLRPFSNRS